MVLIYLRNRRMDKRGIWTRPSWEHEAVITDHLGQEYYISGDTWYDRGCNPVSEQMDADPDLQDPADDRKAKGRLLRWIIVLLPCLLECLLGSMDDIYYEES